MKILETTATFDDDSESEWDSDTDETISDSLGKNERGDWRTTRL